MSASLRAPAISLAVVVILFAAVFVQAEQASNSTNAAPITTVVTVLSSNHAAPPAISKGDVRVFTDKKAAEVTGWVPAKGEQAGMQLAILIDDSVNMSRLARQMDDLAQFIKAQPAETAVGLFYAVNDSVIMASPFRVEHDSAAKALRVSTGNPIQATPNAFASLENLVKRWPVKNGVRREVLFISTGLNRLDLRPSSPYLENVIRNVQAAGVVVHTLYAGGNQVSGQALGSRHPIPSGIPAWPRGRTRPSRELGARLFSQTSPRGTWSGSPARPAEYS
jgi:hypothetical protein